MSNEIDRVEFEVENDFKVIIHCKSLENENKILEKQNTGRNSQDFI